MTLFKNRYNEHKNAAMDPEEWIIISYIKKKISLWKLFWDKNDNRDQNVMR